MLESDSKSNCHAFHLSTHCLAMVGLKVCEMITVGGGAYSLGETLTLFTSGSPKVVKQLVYIFCFSPGNIWNGSSVIWKLLVCVRCDTPIQFSLWSSSSGWVICSFYRFFVVVFQIPSTREVNNSVVSFWNKGMKRNKLKIILSSILFAISPSVCL